MNSDPQQNKGEGRLLLAIKEEQVSVSPEASETIHLAVINQGSKEDYVDILVKGVPSDWVTIETPVVHLSPGETKQFTIIIQPPVLAQSRVGQYPLDVQAVSQSNPKRSASAHSLLIVAAYQSKGRIGVLLGSIYFSISPGSSINIPIILQNRGLQEDSFQLKYRGYSRELDIHELGLHRPEAKHEQGDRAYHSSPSHT